MKHYHSTSLRLIIFTVGILVFTATLVRADLNVAWLRQYGSSGDDYGQGIALDAFGQSWIAGATLGNLGGTGNAGGGDVFLSRISATGTLDFTQQRGTSGDDVNFGVALLGSSTVFTGGYVSGVLDSQTYAGTGDAALLQYNTSGAWQGTKLFGSANAEYVNGLAANATNLFAAGQTNGAFGGQTNAGSGDAFLTKHDATGNLLWTRFVGSSGDEAGNAVALDTAGNSYVTGYTTANRPIGLGSYGIFIARYDTNGNRTLLKEFNSTRDEAKAIKVDSSGNIYLAGYTYGNLGGQINAGEDAFVTKLDSAGNVLWTRLFGGAASEQATSLDLDSAGHVWIGGGSSSTFGTHTNAGQTDAFVAEYDTNGNLLGSQFFGTNGIDVIFSIAIGPDGSAYGTGYTTGVLGAANAGGSDVFVAKIIGVPEPCSIALLLFGGALCLRRRSLRTHDRNA